MHHLTLQRDRKGRVEKGIVDLVSPDKTAAVNRTAQHLIENLDAMIGVHAAYERTEGYSTRVYDPRSGKKLYEVKSVRKRGHTEVHITPLTEGARRYLPQIRY